MTTQLDTEFLTGRPSDRERIKAYRESEAFREAQARYARDNQEHGGAIAWIIPCALLGYILIASALVHAADLAKAAWLAYAYLVAAVQR